MKLQMLKNDILYNPEEQSLKLFLSMSFGSPTMLAGLVSFYRDWSLREE